MFLPKRILINDLFGETREYNVYGGIVSYFVDNSSDIVTLTCPAKDPCMYRSFRVPLIPFNGEPKQARNKALVSLLRYSAHFHLNGPPSTLLSGLHKAASRISDEGIPYAYIIGPKFSNGEWSEVNKWLLSKEGRHVTFMRSSFCPPGTLFMTASPDYVGVYADRKDYWGMAVMNPKSIVEVSFNG